jgi:hypothetical protein
VFFRPCEVSHLLPAPAHVSVPELLDAAFLAYTCFNPLHLGLWGAAVHRRSSCECSHMACVGVHAWGYDLCLGTTKSASQLMWCFTYML